jgi:hypothetical protein
MRYVISILSVCLSVLAISNNSNAQESDFETRHYEESHYTCFTYFKTLCGYPASGGVYQDMTYKIVDCMNILDVDPVVESLTERKATLKFLGYKVKETNWTESDPFKGCSVLKK